MNSKLASFIFVVSVVFNIFFLGITISDRIVSKVLDGDTFILRNGERVRLLGINAPELGRCGADLAKETLTKLVLNKPIILREDKRDTYGRRMGLVYVGSQLVNETMLLSGMARPDYDKNSKSEALKAAYRTAVDAKLGIHSGECKKVSPVPPNPDCTIKGNIDKGTWDHLYHLPACRHYNQIVLDLDIGEQFFCSEEEAIDAGFTLAPDCLR